MTQKQKRDLLVGLLKLEAVANKELYFFFPNETEDIGYCINCERNMYSCECHDKGEEENV